MLIVIGCDKGPIGKWEDPRVILISIDGLNGDRLIESSFKENCPNISRLMSLGTFCVNVQSVFPSLTYPAHTSMISGATPQKHGIVNNQVFKGVGMPHVLMDLQGLPECESVTENGGCSKIGLNSSGKLVPQEYDAAIYDLVNFLAYTAEPNVLERRELGKRVLIFIVIFTFFAWLLNREYWKDVH